jgi:hypothetical protein
VSKTDWPHPFRPDHDTAAVYAVLRSARTYKRGISNRTLERRVMKWLGKRGRHPLGHTLWRRLQELRHRPGYEYDTTRSKTVPSLFFYRPTGDRYWT